MADNEEKRSSKSGETTPEKTGTSAPTTRPPTVTDDTETSSVNTEVESEPSVIYPSPPFNSPEGTIVGFDGSGANSSGLDTDSIAEKLQRTSFDTAPSSLEGAGEHQERKHEAMWQSEREHQAGKAGLRAPIRKDLPLSLQLFKPPPSKAKSKSKSGKGKKLPRPPLFTDQQKNAGRGQGSGSKLSRVSTAEAQAVSESEYHPEFSTNKWEQFATEDVGKALMRLTILAQDEHRKDRSGKSVEEIYSARLAKLIKEADIEFDPAFLS